jgi:hypothetical protein
MTGSTEGKGSGATAVDDVKTEQEVDAGLAKKEAGAKTENVREASGAASGDSPKPHGDKLDQATRAAASKP